MKPALTPTPERELQWIVALTLLYALAALGSVWLSPHPGRVVTLWLASPVGTIAMLALPLRRWAPMLLALAAANLLVNMVTASEVHGWTLQTGLMAATFVPGNCAEMLLAAGLLRGLVSQADVLRQPGLFGQALLLGVVIPAFFSAFAGAMLVASAQGVSLADAWVSWFAGSMIGGVALLPLALALWQQGCSPLLELTRARALGLMLLSAAITLLATSSLPQPYVVVAIALVLVAAQTSIQLTALATLLTAITLEVLHLTGIIVPPPTSGWWGGGLYYVSELTALLPGLFLSTAIDGQAQAMRQLLGSEQRFRTLYMRTPAMLQSIDPQGRITSVSRLWLQTMGYEETEVLGRNATDFLTAESARYAREVVNPQAMRDGRCDYIAYQMVTRNGHVLDVSLSAIWIYDQAGEPLHSLAVIQDVTARKRLEALSHYAQHDPLTGLPNRVLLQDRLERSCVQHARHLTRFAVGFLDLDQFKSINDSHGHDAGDLLLREVARRLQAALRASDTVCRLAGDEFVLLFADIEDDAALLGLAQKVIASVARPCRLGEGEHAPVVDVAASMGLAVFPAHGRDPQTLLNHADQAMYAAKRGGRNRVVFYRAPDR